MKKAREFARPRMRDADKTVEFGLARRTRPVRQPESDEKWKLAKCQ